jgi:hypothetical protein
MTKRESSVPLNLRSHLCMMTNKPTLSHSDTVFFSLTLFLLVSSTWSHSPSFNRVNSPPATTLTTSKSQAKMSLHLSIAGPEDLRGIVKAQYEAFHPHDTMHRLIYPSPDPVPEHVIERTSEYFQSNLFPNSLEPLTVPKGPPRHGLLEPASKEISSGPFFAKTANNEIP